MGIFFHLTVAYFCCWLGSWLLLSGDSFRSCLCKGILLYSGLKIHYQDRSWVQSLKFPLLKHWMYFFAGWMLGPELSGAFLSLLPSELLSSAVSVPHPLKHLNWISKDLFLPPALSFRLLDVSLRFTFSINLGGFVTSCPSEVLLCPTSSFCGVPAGVCPCSLFASVAENIINRYKFSCYLWIEYLQIFLSA